MTDRDTETFVQQVEEEVRRERWGHFLKTYGWWLGGALSAIVLAVAGYEAWKWVTQGQAGAAAERFVSAQQSTAQGDDKAALEAFQALSASGPASYRSAAVLERAARLEQAGDLPGALKGMDEAAGLAADPTLKTSIRLRAAYLAADIEDFAAIQARLTPIIDAGGPLSFLARELLAAEAMEAGQNAIAEQQFTMIRDSLDAPAALQRRAGSFLLTLKPTAPAAATPASSAPAKTVSPGETK